jgi:S-adenosylmethionine-diacylgycerolhomoserine-N-methlytransferase
MILSEMNPRAPDDAASLMDRMYRRQRYIYDASRKFYLLGRDELIESLALPPGGSVLEIGCGTGRNLVKAARTYPTALCFGLDVSLEMLDTACQAVNRAGLGDRIRLAKADATCFKPGALFGQPSFDRIFISYTLSMIPPWRDVLMHSAECLSAGGSLHVVDFGDQSGLPAWFQSGLTRWLGWFDVTPRADLRLAVNDVATALNMRGRVASLFRGYAVHAVVERAFR